jgi:ribosomal protein S9
LSELSLRLRCARAIADAMAAMDAGATREAAARSALLQLEEEMQDELRQSQVLTRDLEAQLEAAKARLSRMVQLRQALDTRAAGAAK